MMALIFAAMTLALALASAGPRWLAVMVALACLVLSTGLFLFEIHSPGDGFRMPWLEVRAQDAERACPAERVCFA